MCMRGRWICSGKVARLGWRLPLYGFLGSIAVALPIALAGNNTGVFLTLPVGVLLALGYLIAFFWNLKRRPVDSLAMILVLLVGGWLCLKYANDGRDEVRWLLGSRAYEAAVLAQPMGRKGDCSISSGMHGDSRGRTRLCTWRMTRMTRWRQRHGQGLPARWVEFPAPLRGCIAWRSVGTR
jgi:hypothetical protein